MSSKKELMVMLERILELETTARDMYDDYRTKFKTEGIVHDYIRIRDEEGYHMGLAQEMIDLVKE